jgi:amino acid transporter
MTVGKDYTILSWMSGWDRKNAAPVPALITQGVLALVLVFLVGTTQGQSALNWLLEKTVVFKAMSWENAYLANADIPAGEKATELAKGGFDTLLTCTAPIFWGFFLLTGISVFVLRQRDPDIERPFKVPLYPELPLIFCVSCGYMLYSSIDYAFIREWKGGLFLLGVLPLIIGLPLYRISEALAKSKE